MNCRIAAVDWLESTADSFRLSDHSTLQPPNFRPVSFSSSKFLCVDARGVKMIDPDPQLLNPRQVEIPTLWVLSRVAPEMVGSFDE